MGTERADAAYHVSKDARAVERLAPERIPRAVASRRSRSASAIPVSCTLAREHARKSKSAALASTSSRLSTISFHTACSSCGSSSSLRASTSARVAVRGSNGRDPPRRAQFPPLPRAAVLCAVGALELAPGAERMSASNAA
eukprot:scaffold31978_cov30-Tisochrysis_lutea.AAC.2